VAAEIAREMIMFVRRGMGQAQFSPILAVQAADREPLRDLQHWILENLHLPLTIEDLADRVHMSPRNFARAFAKQTQVTPARGLSKPFAWMRRAGAWKKRRSAWKKSRPSAGLAPRKSCAAASLES
jgi:AraC-like DNA-binding protein